MRFGLPELLTQKLTCSQPTSLQAIISGHHLTFPQVYKIIFRHILPISCSTSWPESHCFLGNLENRLGLFCFVFSACWFKLGDSQVNIKSALGNSPAKASSFSAKRTACRPQQGSLRAVPGHCAQSVALGRLPATPCYSSLRGTYRM